MQLGTGGAAIPHVDSASVTRTAAAGKRDAVGEIDPVGPVAASASAAAREGTPPEDWSWDRLERVVTLLVEDQQRLRRELAAVRGALDDREQRIRRLEEQLLQANQRRQDTGKRIDELISQLDQLDAQLAAVEPQE